MLNPSVDRLDYGEKLQTPKGFQLSYAVATSYSLELDTLLCLPLALSLNGTLEGNPHGGKLAALEGIRQLKGRLKVFFSKAISRFPVRLPHCLRSSNHVWCLWFQAAASAPSTPRYGCCGSPMTPGRCATGY